MAFSVSLTFIVRLLVVGAYYATTRLAHVDEKRKSPHGPLPGLALLCQRGLVSRSLGQRLLLLVGRVGYAHGRTHHVRVATQGAAGRVVHLDPIHRLPVAGVVAV